MTLPLILCKTKLIDVNDPATLHNVIQGYPLNVTPYSWCLGLAGNVKLCW